MGERHGAVEDLVMFAGVYRDRSVFVTGHTGFKGSWLCQWLLDLGADVTGYALEPPSEPNMFEAIEVGGVAGARPRGAGRFTDLRADVRDLKALSQALDACSAEIVFHMAAQPLVRRSYAEPHLTYETNVMGTVNVLEAVRVLSAAGRGPRACVIVTSDKCYENLETGRARAEGDRLGGHDTYSSSKACAELVTASYRASFFSAPAAPRVASARAGNVVGGGDWGADRLLPDCVRALNTGSAIEIRQPHAVRPWQHVLEPLSGYLWLAARLWLEAEHRAADGAGKNGGSLAASWNFGPRVGAELPVNQVVEAFLEEWGEGSWQPERGAAERPHEAGVLLLDPGKAESELGWRGVWDAPTAVAAAARWYRNFSTGAGPPELAARTRSETADYVEAARALSLPWAGE